MDVGGAEKLLTQITPLMNKAGHQCDVALFDGRDVMFKQQLVEAGVKVIDFAIGKSVYHFSHIWSLKKQMAKYNIVHTHNMSPQLFGAIASLMSKTSLITTEHTTDNRRRAMTWYKPIDKWMYTRYKAVISISPATTQNLKEHTGTKCPIYTIYNGVDVDKFAKAKAVERKAIGVKDDSKLLMQVSRFGYQKDQATVIRAFAKLGKGYELAFVGDGETIDSCKTLAAELGVTGKVHFIGARPDVDNMLKTADFVVQSSHNEGFGLAAVEGMAAGKPVIASDVPGLAEIVKDAGLLFAHEDATELARHIETLATDKEYYNSIVAKCKTRANEYGIQKMVDSYLEVYKSIVK